MSFKGKLIITGIALINSYFIDIDIINLFLAVVLILLFGIPHGSTDHVLFNLLQTGKKEETPKLKFTLWYLMVMTSFAATWYFFPTTSLLLFIIISAYHFGEMQLSYWRKVPLIRHISYLSWGIGVLAIILFSDIDALRQYLVPSLINEEVFILIDSLKWTIVICSIVLFLLLTLFYQHDKLIQETFDLGMLTIISWCSPLLLSFALFFAFWHSKDAIILQLNSFKKYNSDFDFLMWVKLALPFTLVSIVGIIVIIGTSQFFSFQMPVITLMFVLIAIITLPHSLIMSHFIQTKSNRI